MDESRRGGDYFVCAVLLAPKSAAATRKKLRSLLMGGQSRIHMKGERASRRRELLSEVCALEVRSSIYVAAKRSGCSERDRRDWCLRALVDDLVAAGVAWLVIESCDQDGEDRRVIAQHLKGRSLHYRHERPASECLLWLPDIVGWAHGRGGEWRRRATGLLAKESHVGP